MIKRICVFMLGLVLAVGAGLPMGGVAAAAGEVIVLTSIIDSSPDIIVDATTITINISDPITLKGNSGGKAVIITSATSIELEDGTNISVATGASNPNALTVPGGATITGETTVGDSKIVIKGGNNLLGDGGHGIFVENGNVTISGKMGTISGGGGVGDGGGSGIYTSNGKVTISGTTGDILGGSGFGYGGSGINANSVDVTFTGTTGNISGGFSSNGSGGSGINANNGDVTISGKTDSISGGFSSGGDGGSGINANDGDVTISGKTGNISGGGGSGDGGSGINVNSGDVTISGTTGSISGGFGGGSGDGGSGINANNGDVTIYGTTGDISGGFGGGSGDGGSGINANDGDVTISGTTGSISGGDGGSGGGGGIYANGTITINAPVTATGGYNSNGIDANGTITINAQVTVTGGADAYAIRSFIDSIIFGSTKSALIAKDGIANGGNKYELNRDSSVKKYDWIYTKGDGTSETSSDDPLEVAFDTTQYTIRLNIPSRPFVPAQSSTPTRDELYSAPPYTPVNPTIFGVSATPDGTGARLVVSAFSGAYSQSYQWQHKQGDGSWLNIPGATGESFDWQGLNPGEVYTVRCIVSNNSGGYAISEEVTFAIPNRNRGVVTGMNVNVRKGPGTGYASIGKLHKNAEITILGYEAPGGWNKGFYRIAWNGGEAYVSADHVYAFFGEAREIGITGRVYLQTRRSTSSKYRARTLGAGDSVMATGRYRTWWIVEEDGETRFVNNGRGVGAGEW